MRLLSAYARGATRERQVQDLLEGRGWIVTRSAGSHSPHDLHCTKFGDTELVQVKSDRAGPFAHFGPEARSELLGAATQAHAKAVLCWWPPDKKGPRWLEPDSWPT